jgi:hypothetical protein
LKHPRERKIIPLMQTNDAPVTHWTDPLVGRFLRLAASGWIPAGWFAPEPPPREQRARRGGHLRLEIVSHCWQYAHFLIYQLSSLANFPPGALSVTMTVYYNGEDERTRELLAFFSGIEVPGVRWNWRELPRPMLFRRAIGRNHAALNSEADWVWFTDCDLLFREGCLDALAARLQGRDDALVYPRTERVTPLLPDDNPVLTAGRSGLHLVDVDPADFHESSRGRATGPLQITHGDVARACGYCACLPYYQRPSAAWAKAHEDRAFRWLLRTRGIPVDIPGVYRIRHVSKGRYTRGATERALRSRIRRLAERPPKG